MRMPSNNAVNDPVAGQPTAANEHVVLAVRGIAPSGPIDATAEGPWPQLPPDRKVHWERFLRVPGSLEAQIIAGRLNAEGVPTVVLVAPAPDFSDSAEILVPRELAHRARWVMAWPPPSEEELLFLATGEIGPA